MTAMMQTRYLGLQLKNPLVASAGPLTAELDTLKQLAEFGASAVVLPSLFEEQIEGEALALHDMYEMQAFSSPEAESYFPEPDQYKHGLNEYLKKLEEAKKHLNIPVIASLNGCSRGGWTRYAKSMEDAGADALELNIYYIPTRPGETGEDVEQLHLDLLYDVRGSTSLPLAVKFGPGFSSLPNFCLRLDEAGADGLVMFNRFLEPDIDLETMQVVPNLVLSNSNEIRAPLRWIAIVREYVKASLAATSGVHNMHDVVKLLLAGADVVMMTSVLLTRGPKHLRVLLHDLSVWMEEHEYESIEQMKGSMSRANCPDPSALERGNYMKTLHSWR